jgi:D-alanyl-D-alanine carboxypeptidase (penicillin-binding protein 5/6)
LSEPPYPRTTTTPLRRARRRLRRPLPLLLALLPFFAAAAWLGAHGAGSRATRGAPACQAHECQAAFAQVAASLATPPLAPTPCAYCGQDAQRWRSLTDKPPPEIGGKSAALIEGSCGTMVYGLRPDDRLPPASLTKVVSAMVTVDRAALDEPVDVTINGWDLAADDGSSIMGIEAGMRLPVRDLLYGMLLASGNDAALALAQHLGGVSHFVDLMNAKVQQLGLTNTHFVNPDGRDTPDHYSTALDMALLGREFLAYPVLQEAATTQQYQPHWDGPAIWNDNWLLYNYDGAVGVKIGYTEQADFTIVAAARRGGRLLVVSVFGSWNLYLDSVRLLDWAFKNTKPAC